MHNEFTNLLPHERRDALRREYFMRLSVVAALLVTSLSLSAAALLLPTYLFLEKSARAKEARLANIETVRMSTDEAALSVRLAALSSNVAALQMLASAPTASAVIRGILAIPHPKIALSSVAYTPSARVEPSRAGVAGEKRKGTLIISGTAATRNALRAYQLALQKSPLAQSAELPVSSYAADTNGAFTITLTLAP